MEGEGEGGGIATVGRSVVYVCVYWDAWVRAVRRLRRRRAEKVTAGSLFIPRFAGGGTMRLSADFAV